MEAQTAPVGPPRKPPRTVVVATADGPEGWPLFLLALSFLGVGMASPGKKVGLWCLGGAAAAGGLYFWRRNRR